MDGLDESGLAVPVSHGSIELSATPNTQVFNFSRGIVLKDELSSNECWRESGLVGSFDAGQNGKEEDRFIIVG